MQSCSIRIATMHTDARGNQKMPTKKKEPSTLTHTTKTTWKGRYTCQVHTSQYFLSCSNSRRSYPIPTHTQIGKKAKKQGVLVGKTYTKSYPPNQIPSIWLTTSPYVSSIVLPPPNHPGVTRCAPLWRCTLCQEHDTTSKQLPTTKEGG